MSSLVPPDRLSVVSNVLCFAEGDEQIYTRTLSGCVMWFHSELGSLGSCTFMGCAKWSEMSSDKISHARSLNILAQKSLCH